MARKRKALKDLKYESQEYWNRLLVAEGLAVDTGRHPKLILAGGSTDLEVIEKMEFGKQDRRARAPGQGPDYDSGE